MIEAAAGVDRNADTDSTCIPTCTYVQSKPSLNDKIKVTSAQNTHKMRVTECL